jgi:hypothetical protein
MFFKAKMLCPIWLEVWLIIYILDFGCQNIVGGSSGDCQKLSESSAAQHLSSISIIHNNVKPCDSREFLDHFHVKWLHAILIAK